jgi:hypothetical protein
MLVSRWRDWRRQEHDSTSFIPLLRPPARRRPHLDRRAGYAVTLSNLWYAITVALLHPVLFNTSIGYNITDGQLSISFSAESRTHYEFPGWVRDEGR